MREIKYLLSEYCNRAFTSKYFSCPFFMSPMQPAQPRDIETDTKKGRRIDLENLGGTFCRTGKTDAKTYV